LGRARSICAPGRSCRKEQLRLRDLNARRGSDLYLHFHRTCKVVGINTPCRPNLIVGLILQDHGTPTRSRRPLKDYAVYIRISEFLQRFLRATAQCTSRYSRKPSERHERIMRGGSRLCSTVLRNRRGRVATFMALRGRTRVVKFASALTINVQRATVRAATQSGDARHDAWIPEWD
jgi:hypothetical protein